MDELFVAEAIATRETAGRRERSCRRAAGRSSLGASESTPRTRLIWGVDWMPAADLATCGWAIGRGARRGGGDVWS
jgi:hypothetical protein